MAALWTTSAKARRSRSTDVTTLPAESLNFTPASQLASVRSDRPVIRAKVLRVSPNSSRNVGALPAWAPAAGAYSPVSPLSVPQSS